MADEPSYKRRLPAGVVDTSFASLATFLIGLAAVNLLNDVDRGVYSIYFTAFMLGPIFSRDLVFTPAQVRAVTYDTHLRLGVVGQSLTLGIVPALVGAMAAVVSFVITIGDTGLDVAVAFLVTTAATIALSPVQDHVRLMLHIAAKSWTAALVSVVQFVAVVVVLGAMILLDVPTPWIPFGTLAIANAVSLVTARMVSHGTIQQGFPEQLTLKDLASSGKWLVLQSMIPAVSLFAVASMVFVLASPEAAGYAESARVVAQPIMVLAMGLTAVLSPRSMRAAMEADAATARHTNRIFMALISAGAIGYTLVVGVNWLLNPMGVLVPSAYEVQGLVLVTIVSNIAMAFVFLTLNELLGAHREKTLVWISTAVATTRLVIGATAGVTGAFAKPLSLTGGAVTRIVGQNRALRSVYATGGSGRGSTIESQAD